MMTDNKYVDLHIHTNFSDGVFTPQEVVRRAKAVGLSAISITDHDCVDGMDSAIEEGQKLGIEIVPGVELSTEVECVERNEMHILGYMINWKNEQFRESLALFMKSRQKRAHQIFDKLSKLGLHLTDKRFTSVTETRSIGRLHFAKALIEDGYVSTINEAFQKYLSFGRPAYVPKFHLKPDEAIRMILRTGGIPVLAHPFYGHYSNKNLLKGLVRDGLAGIEVWHSKHSQSTVNSFLSLVKEMGLIATGGSDCHGGFGNDPATIGTLNIPYSVLTELKKHKQEMDNRNYSILVPPEEGTA